MGQAGQRLHLAVLGYGKLGRICSTAIMREEHMVLSGIVRKPESVTKTLPLSLKNVPVVSHIRELKQVDAALLCVPTEQVQGVAQGILQACIPIIECATLHGEAFLAHKHALDKIAMHHKVPAIVGAGWDPGALSLFRGLFALLTPKGHTEMTRRTGVSLHHTTAASAIPGVKDALSTELRSIDGKPQRYIYVELEEGASLENVENALQSDPLFLGEETKIFVVDKVAELEQEGQGVLLQRHGSAADAEHQSLLLEARFSEYALTAQIMLAAARALPALGHHAYSLFDIPLHDLWGDLSAWAQQEWL